MTTKAEYGTVLGDLKSRLEALEAERDRLVTAISVLEGAPAAEPQKIPITVRSVSGPGDYSNMTITDAAVHFLRTEGTPQKTADITRALKAGGQKTESKNPYRMVYNALKHRSTTKKDIRLTENSEWALKR